MEMSDRFFFSVSPLDPHRNYGKKKSRKKRKNQIIEEGKR
jgi:hypothetical protein